MRSINNMEQIYLRLDKSMESLNKLEQSKDRNLYVNYKDSIKQHSKTYRINIDIVSKLLYEASYGDLNNRINGIIDSLNTSTDNFLKKIKTVSTNVYGADMIYGPAKGTILSSRDSDNNWYYILKNVLKVTIKANQYYISKYEKEQEKQKEKDEEQEKQTNRKLLKAQKEKEEEEKQKEYDEKQKKDEDLQEALNGLCMENWDDEEDEENVDQEDT